MKKLSLLVVLALAACSPAPKTEETVPSASSVSSKPQNFSMPALGMSADRPMPATVRAYYPSRFIQNPEPMLYQLVGNYALKVPMDRFCKEILAEDVLLDCKIVNEGTPHLEFYWSMYNQYDNSYDFTGHYALFWTKSKAYPALLFVRELPGSLTEAEAKAILQKAIESPGRADDEFVSFVRSISVHELEKPEVEWQTFESKRWNFSIEIPTGLKGGEYPDEPTPEPTDDRGASFGYDGWANVNWFKDKAAEDAYFKIYEQYMTGKKKIEPIRVGPYDAEKITMPRKGNDSVYYSVVSPNSRYMINFGWGDSYTKEEIAITEHMLQSFRILE